MTITINYKKNTSKKKISNIVLFVDEKFDIRSIKKNISSSEYKFITDLIKTKDLKKKF